MTDKDDFWGPTIFSYSRKQAIEDGVLVDLNAVAPEVTREHFKHPVAITSTVWVYVEESIRNNPHQSVNGIVHDILHMSKHCVIKEIDETTRLFEVIINNAVHKLKIVCGPGDTPAPVLTIMFPYED